MTLTRYEHENMRHLIDGYMTPLREHPLETRQEQFDRAKDELLGHLRLQIERVEGFSFEDMRKKVS